LGLSAQFIRKRPDKSRVLLKHAPYDRHVQAFFKKLVRLLAARDGPDCSDEHFVADLFFDSFGKRGLAGQR